jgi:hypothetical protein
LSSLNIFAKFGSRQRRLRFARCEIMRDSWGFFGSLGPSSNLRSAITPVCNVKSSDAIAAAALAGITWKPELS